MFVVGLLVIVRRHASSLERRWALAVVAGPTCRRSEPCVVVGLSLARTRRRWWAHLSSFGGMRRHRAILLVVGLSFGLSSSLVGPFVIVGRPIRCRWVAVRADSSSLERSRALLVFIGSRRCWGVLLFVIGSSFPHAGIIRMTMVGVGWSCLIRSASVGQNVSVEHMWSEARKKEKNDENKPRSKLWFLS